MNRAVLGFLLIAGMAWGQTSACRDYHAIGDAGFTLCLPREWDFDALQVRADSLDYSCLVYSREIGWACNKTTGPNYRWQHVEHIVPISKRDAAIEKARLIVMQKALDYIAKMAARNPHEEQDAGEFLEKMGRVLAGSEGK